jgi:predicted signal transduction protein with EAL and GGDEF domain
LRRVAARLDEALPDAFVARLGGDEFVIVARGGADAAGRLAEGALAAVAVPTRIDGNDLTPSASLGIAIAPNDGDDARALLKNADLALHRAKELGRGTFCFFEEQFDHAAQARRRMEADLRAALAEGQFALHFQPLFDLAHDRIGSFEALLRWRHPVRGPVSPAEFIPIAEETGLIVEIGAWVLREACQQAVRWPDHVRVAVNVSSVQIRRPGLNEVVMRALAASGLAPTRLELEITESLLLDGSEATLKLLHGLRTLGVKIALDDFGTGYSSLSYLQSFPFDKIKIDQSFIRDLLKRPGAVAIVRAITDLARALGMETTAEGVEEGEQLDELRKHGCSSVQGYLFSRPIAASAVHALLADDAPPLAAAG